MYEARKEFIRHAVEYVQAKNPKAGIELNITDVYGNIADALNDDNRKCVEYIFEAMKELDIEHPDAELFRRRTQLPLQLRIYADGCSGKILPDDFEAG